MSEKEKVTIVVMGHPSGGRSTLTGRLICELDGEVPKGNEKYCGCPTSYSKVLNKASESDAGGANVDLHMSNFETERFDATIIDAPGRRDHTKNMITAIALADIAVLVVSLAPGEFEEGMAKDGRTREFLLLARTKGIKQLIIAANKIDATKPVRYSQERFDQTMKKLARFGKLIGYDFDLVPQVPISALYGDNVVSASVYTDWYTGWTMLSGEETVTGQTLVQAIDATVVPERPVDKPLRMVVKLVHDITDVGAVPVGTVASGVLKEGMMVMLAPQGVATKIESLEVRYKRVQEALPGTSVAFHVKEITAKEIKRGTVVSDLYDDPAKRTKSFVAEIIVIRNLGKIAQGYTPIISCSAAHVACRFEEIQAIKDSQTGEIVEYNPETLKIGDHAMVKLVPQQPMCVETFSEYPSLGQIVVRDSDYIIGVGIITSVESF